MKRLLLSFLVLAALPLLCRGAIPPGFWKAAVAGGSAPAWGGLVATTANSTGNVSVSPLVITLSAGVANTAGNRVGVVLSQAGHTTTVLSAIDSGGNSWTVDKQIADGNGSYTTILSAPVSTSLISTNTISITLSATSYGYYAWQVFYLANCPNGVDSSASNATYSASPTCSASTVAAATVLVASNKTSDNAAYTYSASGNSGTWTPAAGPLLASGSNLVDYVTHITASSAGTQNPHGTWSTATSYAACWVAYH